MAQNYSELIEYLDERFGKIDKNLENLKETKADKKDVQSLMNSIDRLAKAIETYHHEQTALGAKVDRLEQWITQIAKQTGIELKP